jgi:hypothetical protein
MFVPAPGTALADVGGMTKLILLASLAASGMFAACRHEAPTPQPAPRELPGLGPKPTPVEPTPVPTQLPTTPHTQEGGETHSIAPTDAGTPLPGSEQPSPTGSVNPGPSASNATGAGPTALLETPDTTRRQLHSDDDLILSPSDRAERMPAPSTGAAQPMPSEPGSGEEEPSSIKPDAGILYDAGAPLPPVPDAPPLPTPNDAGKPM